MNHQRVLCASLMLLPIVPATAESAEPADFAIEMVLAERLPPGGTLAVRCTTGCDWETRTIVCPNMEDKCRAVIAGRSGYDPQVDGQEPEPRPVSEAGCTGMILWSQGASAIVECEAGRDAQGYKVCRRQPVVGTGEPNAILHVPHDSPANAAGLKRGDIVLSLNGQAVQHVRDVAQAISGLVGGQPFEAVIERDGQQVLIRGRLGMRLSNSRCVAFDERLLETPAMTNTEVEALQFEIEVAVPTGGATFACLKGCVWPGFITGEVQPSCVISIERGGYSAACTSTVSTGSTVLRVKE